MRLARLHHPHLQSMPKVCHYHVYTCVDGGLWSSASYSGPDVVQFARWRSHTPVQHYHRAECHQLDDDENTVYKNIAGLLATGVNSTCSS